MGLAGETPRQERDTQKRYWTAFAHPVPFEHISVNEGLSHNTINSILQDRRGFLWFGTENGLNRCDGYNFKILRGDLGAVNSLASSWVNCQIEDHNGKV